MLGLKSGLSLNTARGSLRDEYALKLTGTEYVSLDEAADEFDKDSGAFSVWVQLSSMSGSGHIMKIQVDANNFVQLFYHNNSGEMRFAYKGGGAATNVINFDASSLEGDGTWHHLYCSWQTASNRLALYLDGEQQAYQTSGLGAFSGTPTVFDIGQNTAGGNFFKGFVSEAALFDSVVGMSAVYNTTTKNRVINLTGQANLVGYWRFNEGAGGKALDSSGNVFTGDIFNTPDWITDIPE